MPIDDNGECCHDSLSADEGDTLDSINGSNKTVESPSVVSRKRKKTDEGDLVIDPLKDLGMNYTELMKDLEYKNVSGSELVSEDKNGSESEHLDSITGSNKTVESVESTSAVLGNSNWAGGFYRRDDEETKHELLHTHETKEEHENAGPNWFYRDPDGKESEHLDSITGSNKTVESVELTSAVLGNSNWAGGFYQRDDEETKHELLHTHETQEEHENAGPNWFFRDPDGKEQGPVSRNTLKSWSEAGYFAPAVSRNNLQSESNTGYLLPDTTVWRVGQTANEAILLRKMLSAKIKRTDSGDVVIDLSDDEDTTHDSEEVHDNTGPNWFYRDPQGLDIGPVPLKELKKWFYGLFLCPDTTVWRVGQTPNKAILLRDMLARKRTDEGDDPDQKFPTTLDVPLDKEEKKIWRDFKEFDKNHWKKGLVMLDLNIVDIYKRPLPLKDPIVSLTSKFAVTAFNEAIEMYVKKGEQNNIYDFDVVECKYLKMRRSRYYFFITIDAFEERIRGVYDATVRLEWKDGRKSLMQFILTDRKPHDDNKTMKLMKLKTDPGSWRDGSRVRLSGMRRRRKNGICRGYYYEDPYRRIVPP